MSDKITPLFAKNSLDTAVNNLYDNWSNDYDKDLNKAEYRGPVMTADKVLQYCQDNKDMKILDVGAGSGFVGVELKKRGYHNLDAVDSSSNMLQIAKDRNIYQHTFTAFVGPTPLPMPDNTYDCIVASGIVLPGHLPPDAMTDICRLLKPGGTFVMLSNYQRWYELPEYNVDMTSVIKKLEEERKWVQLEWSCLPNYINIGEGKGLCFVYQKLYIK